MLIHCIFTFFVPFLCAPSFFLLFSFHSYLLLWFLHHHFIQFFSISLFYFHDFWRGFFMFLFSYAFHISFFLFFDRRSKRCPRCETQFPTCVVTGRPLMDYQFWMCSTCKHRAYEQEIRSLANCPLCHTAI